MAVGELDSLGFMKTPGKTLRRVALGLGIALLVLGGISIYPLKRLSEFSCAETVKGYWASLQPFVQTNGRYPRDDAELGALFHETPVQLQNEPVVYLAPHDTNTDEIVLWLKHRSLFGAKIGITESGMIVKQ